METFNLKCTFEERYSEKTKKNFKAVFLKLDDDCEKMIFLTIPEQKLLESYYSKEQNTEKVDFSNFS